jgi:Zn-dependent peptidase ImmA (M78 family)/transcriptional regulator with XRE-family HTH domain
MADKPNNSADQASFFSSTSQRTANVASRLRPSKLREARLAMRLTQTELADRVGVKRQSVSMYEAGQTSPEPAVMERIATELEQPLSYFVDDPPLEFGDSSTRFFRAFGANTKRRNLACEVLGGWLVKSAKFLDGYVNFPPLDVPAAYVPAASDGNYTPEEIEVAAANCRRSWGLGLGPISNVVSLLENKGIVVSRYVIPRESIEAFSFWNGDRPFVFLASEKESAVRARFDAAHELGHLILHRGIGTEDLEDNKERLRTIEREADRFANAFLLPAESFAAELFSAKLDAFVPLKRRWKVSIQAMVVRCRQLELIDEDQYTNLYKTISFRKWRKREPQDDVLPLEEPKLLSHAVNLLLSSGQKSADDVALALQVNRGVIEELCNVPAGTLHSKANISEFRPTLKANN